MNSIEREVFTRVLYEFLMARIANAPVGGSIVIISLERSLAQSIARNALEPSRYSPQELAERVEIARVVVARIKRELRSKKAPR